MVASIWSPVRAHLFTYGLCTLRCSFLIFAASKTRCKRLTDHPSAATITVTWREGPTNHLLAASSTLQQRLLIDLTGTRDSLDDHRECCCYWESITLHPLKEDEIPTTLLDWFQCRYYSCFINFADKTITCDFWNKLTISTYQTSVLPALTRHGLRGVSWWLCACVLSDLTWLRLLCVGRKLWYIIIIIINSLPFNSQW